MRQITVGVNADKVKATKELPYLCMRARHYSHWSDINRLTVFEARRFANCILQMCDEIEKEKK